MEERSQDVFRGDILYIYPSYREVGSEQYGGRPAIVVSNDKCNKHSSIIEVVYLTTKEKTSLPTHVDISSAFYPSIALCECVNSVSKSRIGGFVGVCTKEEMAHVDAALCVSLGIEPQEVKRAKSAEELLIEELGKTVRRLAELMREEAK